jgi:hypothetical protein
MLSGKQLPGKVAKLSTNRKEAAEQLLAMYDSALTFLRSHGALLNAVKPEMLLEAQDLERCVLMLDGHTSLGSSMDRGTRHITICATQPLFALHRAICATFNCNVYNSSLVPSVQYAAANRLLHQPIDAW